jgi:hypothetical protein
VRRFTVLYLSIIFFKFLAKLLLPLIVKKVVKKAGENYQQQQEKAQDTSWKKGNPEMIIYNDSNLKNQEKLKVGDYVDYEELD